MKSRRHSVQNGELNFPQVSSAMWNAGMVLVTAGFPSTLERRWTLAGRCCQGHPPLAPPDWYTCSKLSPSHFSSLLIWATFSYNVIDSLGYVACNPLYMLFNGWGIDLCGQPTPMSIDTNFTEIKARTRGYATATDTHFITVKKSSNCFKGTLSYKC